MLNAAGLERITQLFKRAGLPTVAPDIGVERYLQLMELDKKVEGGKMRFVVLEKIGQACVKSDIPLKTLSRILEAHG